VVEELFHSGESKVEQVVAVCDGFQNKSWLQAPVVLIVVWRVENVVEPGLHVEPIVEIYLVVYE
jgi:hypothetical protein